MPIKTTRAMRRVIRSTDRFTEVTAVPGGGKTTTAVARVKHLLNQDPAARIQILSATNATVVNFRQRLQAADVNISAGRVEQDGRTSKDATVNVSTIHALFYGLIRRHHRRLGYRAVPAVVDPSRLTKILERIDGSSHAGKTGASFCAAKQGSARRSAVRSKTSTAKLTRDQAYEDHKRSSGAIDYDDMLRLGLCLMAQLSGEELGIDHLIVDEWQDCTPTQAKLIAGLAQRVQTTAVLGDRLQMIYGFAGGRYTSLRRALVEAGVVLVDDESKKHVLRRSHRLTAEIADLAQAVAAPLDPPAIKTDKTGTAPALIQASDTRTLASTVAKRVSKLLRRGVPPSEIALLGRTRAVLHPLAQELAARNVATLLAGSDGHYQAVLDVLWLVDKFEDLRDYGIGLDASTGGRRARMTAELEAEMRDRLGLDDSAWLIDLSGATEDYGADPNVKTTRMVLPKLEKWDQFVNEFLNITGGKNTEGAYRACVRAYLRLHGGVNANKVLRNALNRWEPLSRRFACAAEMSVHIQEIAGTGAITCSTIHAAKGMEWDYVFVIGVTEGVLPDRRSTTVEKLDEERRVLYVAITRARKRIWLGHSPIKVSGVRREYSKLSRFLVEPGVQAALQCAV
ncbi:ATP-dependent helicase [Variovorax paradoxus]|uniref:3'-5' exonuclease n=1 Tax=Variovorax paradoxus TaxID=34073 RepID=UPI0021ACE842|nr:ATP-dependent helicase [Variovorax paradoxus]UVH55093.1 ATP-dependent helicase [Variovorax paradoxus]